MKHKSRLKPVELMHKSHSLEEAGVQSTGVDEEGMEMFNDPNSRLLTFIKKRARNYRRPVLHTNDCVEVHMRASLYQIVDLDQRNNLATLTAYFDVWWNDPFIAWNSTDFYGITKQFVPLRWLWRPEFYLYHSIQGRVPDVAPDMSAEVHEDGRVRSFLPITARALCPLNLKYAPFDTQNCSFF
uniref:Neurotransmitter-gated ion-channel ligand-binding domain-containing protein n=1 Tax=Panagrolaimus superbus TaxID=310955 RepID=A0A914Z029_9BILA